MGRQSISSIPQNERKPLILTWDRRNPREVSLARERFLEYVKAGWLAFAVPSEDRRVQIFKFDPKLETIILIPFAEGG